MKWLCCIAVFALSGCIYAMLAGGIAATSQSVKVVPAAEAPAPPPGEGWHCFDYQAVRHDTHDGTSSASARDSCHRTRSECQRAASGLASAPSGGSRTYTSYQVGTCVSQATAACSYSFAGKTHECYRGTDTCGRATGGMMLIPKGSDPRISECAEYP